MALEKERPVIYQLLVRLFGNTNETREPWGTMEKNGCGKFADINGAALDSLKEMGFTHLWLTGVPEQASGTSYPDRPGDQAAILKGLAGSPYAIKDYFDVCPDYAEDPKRRREEFADLVERCHAKGFKVIVDYVPNHVSRAYRSDVHPLLSFGEGDNPEVFFDRDNHFYYLRPEDPGGGPPLRLPVDGLEFELESEYGKVTGNNVISWRPSSDDWYETVKLNYGHDFTKGRDTSHLPGPEASPEEVPKTWRTMDEILAWWQGMGVDGFRVDMAHIVPMEFWRWELRRARERNAETFFMGEAYDSDPAKLTDGNVLDALLEAGFDSVYDHPAYHVLKGIYESGKRAGDLDPLMFTGERFHRVLRYAENHDEVRLANPEVWGGHGMRIGKPVTAVLFGMSRSPVMIYHGQEVGEPCGNREGFSGDPTRTTIFDYWSMREFSKWVNGGRYDGGRLSEEQKALRAWYGKLIRVIGNPAFTKGEIFGLDYCNQSEGDPWWGRWLHAFLRHDSSSGQSFLVVANFHPDEAISGVHVRIPGEAWEFMGREEEEGWVFEDRLEGDWSGSAGRLDLAEKGVHVGVLDACGVAMLEIGKW